MRTNRINHTYLFTFQAAYHESPESYIASIENRFSSRKYKCIFLENAPQKCVLAFCDETSTLYIAFRGSKALDDWLVNLDVEPCNFPNLGPNSKVHTGFFKRAESWVNVIMDKHRGIRMGTRKNASQLAILLELQLRQLFTSYLF